MDLWVINLTFSPTTSIVVMSVINSASPQTMYFHNQSYYHETYQIVLISMALKHPMVERTNDFMR